MEREMDFPVLFKNDQKLNFKKRVFSTESKEQHQNLKLTKILMYMKGVAPSTRPCSLAKVFDFLS